MKRISALLLILTLFLQLRPLSLGKSTVRHQDAWKEIEKKIHVGKHDYTLHYAQSLIPTAHAANIYDNASSYITIDYNNGNVLLDKNSTMPVPIASLTKIMSAMVTLDLLKPTDEVTISAKAPTVSPTKIGVDRGERMSVNDLLQAMLMYSANDAAQALHDGINDRYGDKTFVKAMNEKALEIGLTHTHFANPQGFDDPGNYSSAGDLALLSHYALTNYPLIAKIVNQDYTVEPGNSAHKTYDLPNWNGLLGVYPGVSGVKIGNTGDAGYTTVVVSQRNGQKVLAVVLGTPGILQRDEWTAALLDDTFSQAYDVPAVSITPTELRAKYASWYSH